MQLLIIEPDGVLASLYKRALTSAGHQVNIYKGAQAAIESIDKNKPDLILVELNLPMHNGVEFLYELRSYPEWQYIPIIIHSFIGPEELSISESVKQHLGVVSHLYKPQTSLAKLIDAVGDFVPVA